jgi:hypothetical protein
VGALVISQDANLPPSPRLATATLASSDPSSTMTKASRPQSAWALKRREHVRQGAPLL